MAVAAVLLGVAVPAFDRSIAYNRLVVAANQMQTALMSARQMAISRRTAMTFCAGNRQDGCHGDWTRPEWIVFVDRDRDGRLDAGEVVTLADALPAGTPLTIGGNGPFKVAVVFHPSGLARTKTGAFAAGRLRICAAASIHDNARDLVLIGSGRAEPERNDFAGQCPAP